jgi:thiamine biosynthesis protein ThiS
MRSQSELITIHINGSKEDVPHGTTLEHLISLSRLQKKSIVVERNRQVVDKTAYSAIQLKENDQIEIVHFVGGG